MMCGSGIHGLLIMFYLSHLSSIIKDTKMLQKHKSTQNKQHGDLCNLG